MYKLETENFTFELEPYMTDCKLRIKVSSYGFSADTMIDADELYLGDFSFSLNEFYETMRGSVKLQDLSMDSFIEFTAKANGYISVAGRINNGQDYGHGFYQQLTFENEFDQTYLHDLAKTLFADFGEYAGQ